MRDCGWGWHGRYAEGVGPVGGYLIRYSRQGTGGGASPGWGLAHPAQPPRHRGGPRPPRGIFQSVYRPA